MLIIRWMRIIVNPFFEIFELHSSCFRVIIFDKEVKPLGTIGSRVKELRESLNLSQTVFGDRIGVSRDVVNNLERDRVNITDDRLILISKTYGVRYEWLKTGEEPMYPPETDDLLVKVAKVMEGQSEAKRKLVEFICDMPDALLDQIIEYYDKKMENKKK